MNNLNVNPGTGSGGYVEKESLHNEILEKLNASLQPLEGYDFEVIQDAEAIRDVRNATRDIDTILNTMNEGGRVYAIDIETTGNILSDNEMEKNISNILEVGVSSRGFSGGVANGEAIQELNVLFGINPQSRPAIMSLITEAQNKPYSSLTDLQKSDLDRLARLSQSVITDQSTGLFVIKAGDIKYDKRDLGQAYQGMMKGMEIWKKQGLRTEIGQKNWRRIQDLVSKGSSGLNTMVAHNGIRFDFPILEKGLGIKFGKNLFDPLYAMNSLNYDPDRFYSQLPDGNLVKSHYMRQTSLLKGMGVDVIQAHTASEDTDALVKLISESVLVKDLKNKSNEIMASKRVLNSNQPVFKMESSLKKNPLGDSGISLDFKSMLDPSSGKEVVLGDRQQLRRAVAGTEAVPETTWGEG